MRPPERQARPVNAQQARQRRREAARARQAARRRRDRRRRLGIVLALVVVVVAGIGGLAVSASRAGRAATVPGALPGLQTGPAPWSANTADLAARLRAIGLPPLSPR
jgi:fatty acid desaturase